MSSKSSSSFMFYEGPIGQGIEDNGPKWGSNVKRNFDGSFPFDHKMKEERPTDWEKMIQERVAPIYETARNPPRKIPKKWAEGKPRPD